MTGRDLIIYILQNNLEDEPIFEDTSVLGFISVNEAATKMGVGIPTIYALIQEGSLQYIQIGDIYFVTTK